MEFKVVDSLPSESENTVYLVNDNWDDWFEFETLYIVYYDDENQTRHAIGTVKIGELQIKTRAAIPKEFDSLEESFFSLGQSVNYYKNLNNLDNEIGNDILKFLNDISYNLKLFKKIENEKVTRVSLLRTVTSKEVSGQFNRIAHGGAELTPYNFKFISPKPKNSDLYIDISFDVIPNSSPSTNVHVLIGRNGVGKTHLLNNMLNSVFSSEKTTKHGIFQSDEEILFSNVVSVSFSAFDESEPKKEQKDKTKGVKYSYIGLKRTPKGDEKDTYPKSPVMLKNEFIKSLYECQLGNRKERWIKAVEILESDPMFQESEIIKLIEIKDEKELKDTSSEIFNKLSSGHKIVLLTITRLVETVEEKTLVMLDEPESHLHPPLLSAFIRALSELLILRNGVAIIATHSPVILQEVPKSCVSILSRSGISARAERPEKETFGENIGILTHAIFGLEVTNSGFYNLIKKSVSKNNDYNSVKLDFDNKLGMEARAIAKSIMYIKNNKEI